MDFWSSVNMAMLAMLHDYHRELDRRADFYQKCREKISDDACDMADIIEAAFEGTDTGIVPKSVLDGMENIPVYAFYLVLRAQGGVPTREQNIMIDLLYRHLKPVISKPTLLGAARNGVGAHELETLVGLSESSCGEFWKLFFKAVYLSNSKTLSDFIQLFCDIVMRFSVIGNPKNEVSMPVCEKFINAAHKQADAVVNGPEDDLDLLGEVSYVEHKERAYRYSMELVKLARQEEALDMDTLVPIYFITMICDLMDMTTLNRSEKAAILDFIMSDGGIDCGMGGSEFVSSLEAGDDFAHFTQQLSDNMPIVITDLCDKAARKDMCKKVLCEYGNFLIGAEAAIVRKFPRSGLGKKACGYWSDRMQHTLDLIDGKATIDVD